MTALTAHVSLYKCHSCVLTSTNLRPSDKSLIQSPPVLLGSLSPLGFDVYSRPRGTQGAIQLLTPLTVHLESGKAGHMQELITILRVDNLDAFLPHKHLQ